MSENFRNRDLFVIGFLDGNDLSVRRKQEMNSRVGHQVGLELNYVDVCASSKPMEEISEEMTLPTSLLRLV